MSDVNANININIDTTSASAQLRSLEAQLSDFNSRVIASNAKAVAAQREALKLLQTKIGDTGAFTTQIKSVETSVARFSTALEKGKLSFGEYFRYGLASTKKFGRAFDQELATIEGLAEARVKKLSTRYIALGQDINGAHRALAITPNELGDGIETKLALAAQKQQIFNQLLKQGSTHLVNWGKNTQWAGRQLMVGFTVPLTIFGGVAAKIFTDLEKQTIAFQRVYGDLMTPQSETNAMTDQIKALASEYTKWGISVSDTMKMAADAAASGSQGAALISQTTQATKLATLGQMDQTQALKSTIAMQNAFKMSNQEVADSVNFLNAVENQTVVSLDDITQAIPRVAPVIQGLGGDIKDLSVFMAAMQEGGVGAAEGANALKSGLASLINPTKQAREQLSGVGIDIDKIIETNRGDLMGTVTGFADALKELDNTTKQQVLAQVFGKYQFARLGALFENITVEGSQASKVMGLAGMSMRDLASLSDKELGKIENAVSVKFQASIEKLKLAIAPIGELFLKIATPIVNAATKILEVFNSLPDGVKTAVTVVVGLMAGIAPVFLMGVGLIANGIGNLMKGFGVLRTAYQRMVGAVSEGGGPLAQAFGYLTEAELDAIAAGEGLDGKLRDTTGNLLIQKEAVEGLANSYRSLVGTMGNVQAANPQGFTPIRGRAPRKMAEGGMVGGKGNKDSEPALLMPGEFVMTKEASQKYGPILAAMNAGSVAGYAQGRTFDVGGKSITLDLAGANTQKIQQAIERRIEEASNIGEGALQALGEVLEGLVGQVDLVVSRVDDAIRQVPEIANIAKSGERTGAPTTLIRQGERPNMQWETKQSEIAAVQSEVASLWPEIAGNASRMDNLLSTQVSHLESMDANGNIIARTYEDLANLTPDLGTFNNYLNRIKNISLSSEDIERIMGETGLSWEEVNTEVDKLMRQIHPITEEAGKVYTAIGRIDEELSLDLVRSGAPKSAKTRIGTTAATGYQATALRAAGDVRATATPGMGFAETVDSRQYVPAGTRIAQGINDGIEQGNPGIVIEQEVLQNAKAASPPPWSDRLGVWIGQGINNGMQRTVQQPNLSASQMRGAATIPGGRPQLSVDPKMAASLDAFTASLRNATTVTQMESVASTKDTIATGKEAIAHQKNAAAIEKEKGSRSKGLGGMSKFLYAVDGVSMAMSFLPGPLGDIANKAFIVSASLSALDAILRVELIDGALKKFGAALMAINGGKLAGALTGVKGAGAGVGLAAGGVAEAALSLRTKKLEGEAAAKAASTLTKFGKVIGPVVVAVSSFGGWILRLGKSIGPLLGNIVKLVGAIGKAAAAIPGIGWIVAAVTTAVTAFMYIGKYKNVGDQIRDMGNAAKFATEELQGIADKFGFTTRTSGFAQSGTVLGNTQESRTVAQEAKTYVQETEAMQNKVGVVKGASDVNAEAIFRGMFMDLIAQGAPKDVAIGIVEAVANEAGKQKVFVPVQAELQASIDDTGKIEDVSKFIESNLKPTLTGLQTQFDQLSKTGFNQMIDKGAIEDAKRWETAMDGIPDSIAASLVPQYEQKKAILETAKQFELLKTNSKTAMDMLSAQFVNGEISIQKFDEGMAQIQTTLSALPANQGLEIMKQQLIELYPDSQAAVESITDAGMAFDILNLQAQGVNMSGFVSQINAAGNTALENAAKLNEFKAAQAAITGIDTEIAKLETQLAAEQAKPSGKKGKSGSGGGSKDPFAGRENKLRNEQAEITIKEIKIDRQAEGMFDEQLKERFKDTKVTVGGIDIPIKSIADSEYAITMIGEEIENIERGPLQGFQDQVDSINESIDTEQKLLDDINHTIDMQQQKIAGIERQYKPILDSLNDQKKLHEDALQALQDQMDAQTKPIDDQIYAIEKQKRAEQEIADERFRQIDDQQQAYDDQISAIDDQEAALQKVADINQFLIDQQKRQVSLSEALSQGDIYAATQAAQEMRAAEAANAVDQQKNAFEEQKKQIEDKQSALDDEKQAIQDRLDRYDEETAKLEYKKYLIEDTYRLSLRAEEDAISAIDKSISKIEDEQAAKIKPYQDIIDTYAPEIERINNSIYAKEQDIKKIQEEKIKPLEDQIKRLNRQKDILDDINGDINTSIARQKQELADRKKYLDQELQILAAKKEIADLESGGGGGGTAGTRNNKLIKDLQDQLAKLRADKATQQGKLPQPGTSIDKSWYSGALESAKSAWTAFSKWFTDNVITPVVNAWNTVYAVFDQNVIQPIKTAWNGFISNVKAVVETFAALFVAIGQLFYENVIAPIKQKWDEWWANTIQPKLDAFAIWWESVKLKFGLFVDGIKAKWNEFWAANIQPKIDLFLSVWETIKSRFGGFVDSIKAYWNTFWENSIQPKIDIFLGLWDKVKQKFIDAFAAIGAWWDDWKTKTFDEKVAAMKSSLSSIFDPETWKGWATTAFNAVKGIWNSMDPGIHLAAPDWISNIPGMGWMKGMSWDVDDFIPDFATGGPIVPGAGGRDSTPAMLTPGEFIVRKAMVDKYGIPMLNSINQGAFSTPKYATPSAKGIGVTSGAKIDTTIAPVYNSYEVNVNVSGTNASADEIANKAVMRLQGLQNMQVRSARAN